MAHRVLSPFQEIPRRPERQPDVWLTERQAAEYCLYFDRGCTDPVRSFQQWARRLGIPVRYVGRSRQYQSRVLDAFTNREGWTRRHRPVRRSA